jgi:hypothetical protein
MSTIGRFDIHTAVMTISGFRIAPRIGHLERQRRIYGYLSKMRFATIHVRAEEPDFSDVPDHQYDLMYTVYGNTKEGLPKDAPEPLGKHLTLSHYVEANLMHDVTRKISYRYSPSCQQNTVRLVFQETSHRRNCNLLF